MIFDTDKDNRQTVWKTQCPSGDFEGCFHAIIRKKHRVVNRMYLSIEDPGKNYHEEYNCNDAAGHVRKALLLIAGIPSSKSHAGFARRQSARSTWLQNSDASLECFVLARNAHVEASNDIMFVNASETSDMYPLHRGRSMPTFKQFEFFRQSVRRWPRASYIAKIDDDTIVNIPFLLRLLLPIPSSQNALIGAIHWCSVIPINHRRGIYLDRCSFGFSLRASLRYIRFCKCDKLGGTLPLPYAAGAAYVFTRPLLKAIVENADLNEWIEYAKGTQELQWQNNEDASTGYFVRTIAPGASYYNIKHRLHDFSCKSKGMYHVPGNTTVILHGMKKTLHARSAWSAMQNGTAFSCHTIIRNTSFLP
jgi:hypothetical protein